MATPRLNTSTDVSTFLAAADAAEARLAIHAAEATTVRTDTVGGDCYVGKAADGVADTDEVWTITKISVDSVGDITRAQAIDVAWTNRLTETYTPI